jgi:hypothetical protein
VSKRAIATLTAALLLALSGLRLADLWWWRTQTLTAADERAANLDSILSEHGGSVLAESEGDGKGATFRVRLPMKPID